MELFALCYIIVMLILLAREARINQKLSEEFYKDIENKYKTEKQIIDQYENRLTPTKHFKLKIIKGGLHNNEP